MLEFIEDDKSKLTRIAQKDHHEFSRFLMAQPPGFEPGTVRLEGGCSIQLSYRRIVLPPCGESRGERIRTSDIRYPKPARYQAALHPEPYDLKLPNRQSRRGREVLEDPLRFGKCFSTSSSLLVSSFTPSNTPAPLASISRAALFLHYLQLFRIKRRLGLAALDAHIASFKPIILDRDLTLKHHLAGVAIILMPKR